jgi:ABC-type phosphate transport system substrate-binding protein
MNHSFSKCRSLGFVLAAVLAAVPVLSQADIYVIANSSLSVTPDDIRLIYTGDKELAGSVKVRALDNHTAQSEFLTKVLQLNPNRYDALWTMKSFRDGLTPPVSKPSDAEVIAYVESTPGAIGYVTSAPPPGVVVVKKY